MAENRHRLVRPRLGDWALVLFIVGAFSYLGATSDWTPHTASDIRVQETGDDAGVAWYDDTTDIPSTYNAYIRWNSDTLETYALTGTGTSTIIGTQTWFEMDDAANTITLGSTSEALTITLNDTFVGTVGGSFQNQVQWTMAPTTRAINLANTSDSSATNFSVYTDGEVYWGASGALEDTLLYRSAADTLSMGAGDDFAIPNVASCDAANEILTTNASGVIACGSRNISSDKSWAFESPSGGSGVFYYAGYLADAGSDNDFNPSVNLGTANNSYAAHVYFVCAAGGGAGTDTVVRVTGTSINDSATRTAADTEDVTIDDAGAAGAWYETSKKFIGQVSVAKQSGPDLLCNYGWAKYWDWNNANYTVTGLEVTGLAGANDTGFNVRLLHYTSTGWTYNAGASATPPTPIAALQTDHVTEYEINNGQEFAWKRSNLSADVDGASSEGVIWEVTTTANKAVETGNIMMTVQPQ